MEAIRIAAGIEADGASPNAAMPVCEERNRNVGVSEKHSHVTRS